jgi:WD40 repeat protein
VARLGTTNWRHTGIVCFSAFLPDGKSVITADDETIRVWEFPLGKLIRRIDLPFPVDPALRVSKATTAGAKLLVFSLAVALSNDGKTVACFFEKKAILCTKSPPANYRD